MFLEDTTKGYIMGDKKEKRQSEKIETAMEQLKRWPVAMQVGPQPHLRKGWGIDQAELKGGVENREKDNLQDDSGSATGDK